MNEDYKIDLVFSYGNYEWRATCSNLNDVQAAIDDWSTDFCEDGQLRLWFAGRKEYVPINVWTERSSY